MAKHANYNDIVGKKFNKLKVIGIEKVGNKRKFLCECECGNKKIVEYYFLKENLVKSCGCYMYVRKHGKRNTKIYKTYIRMKQRCYYEKKDGYERYGGRGIKVCDEWLNDFMSFYNWAIENGYDEKLSIDRIDVNGNYEPGNCRWVGMDVQAKNKDWDSKKRKEGKEVLKVDVKTKKTLNIYPSQKDVCVKYGISLAKLSTYLSKNECKELKGFIWKYADMQNEKKKRRKRIVVIK